MAGLNNSEIIELLEEADTELGDLDEPVSLLCVGGAAIALKWGDRYTKDVDIVSDNVTSDLRAAVARVGQRRGLPPDWLNDGAKGFAPNLDSNPSPLFVGNNLILYGADAQYILAMKLVGAREDDLNDLILLMRQSGLNKEEELFNLVERSYPTRVITLKTQYIIEESVKRYNQKYPDR